MFNGGQRFNVVSRRTAFLLVFGLVTLVLVGSSFGVVAWIADRLEAFVTPRPANATYTAYDPGNAHLKPESIATMSAYIQANPQPQNAQILKGWTTAQIANYMVSQVSGGLRVDCTYCHVLSNGGNFSLDTNPNKVKARVMMRMVADVNQNWVVQLQQSVGTKQATCATCHNGQPKFETYPAAIQNTLPANYQLPLGLEYPGGLTVTGRQDKSLEDVALNQQTMYHMNVSLGVGCTFCHNARYFPSNEVPQKGYAGLMIRMVQSLDRNAEYKTAMNNRTLSCYTCHREAQLPPGSANTPELVPPQLSTNPGPGQSPLQTSATCLGCHPQATTHDQRAGQAATMPEGDRQHK